MYSRTRHKVAAHQPVNHIVLSPAVRIVLLPRIQEQTINRCRAGLSDCLPGAADRIPAPAPLFGHAEQQTPCAEYEILGNRHQTILTPHHDCDCDFQHLYQPHGNRHPWRGRVWRA
jgi:hypothetical protein